MRLTVLGSGDAFGSGGRLQTCFHVSRHEQDFLIDCGATAMIAMNGLGLDPNRIGVIFVSHLHGDHFAGLVWFLLHADYVAKRSAPLDIVGPPGIEQRLAVAAEALFPGTWTKLRDYPVHFHEIGARVPFSIAGIDVTAYAVSHPSGAPSHALRIACDGRVIAFSGDTEWVEDLIEVADGADLYITECYGYEQPTRYHLTWRVIAGNLARLRAKRIMLTHMSQAMLERGCEAVSERVILGEDGLGLDVV